MKFRGAYSFLSNFAEVPGGVKIALSRGGGNHVTCPTVEHAFAACKTTDREWRKRIAGASSPGEAKRLGRRVELREDWEACKLGVMRSLLAQKFARGSHLAAQLLATGDEPLTEDNDWNDTYWGVCNGVGQNWLGRLLMERREALRA